MLKSDNPILTSRNIGETENALRAILMRVLTGTGLDYPRWIALQFVSLSPSPVAVEDLEAQLTRGLKIDDATARQAIVDLRSRQILRIANNRTSTTETGSSLYERLRDQIRPVTQRLYADLSVDDLAVAYRVLAKILERANALLEEWEANRSLAGLVR